MRKNALLLAIALLCTLTVVSCGRTVTTVALPEGEDTHVTRVFYLNGSTGMGMAKLINDNTESGKYEFTGAASADEIVGSLVRGEYDIAAVPTTLALNLYKRTEGALKIAAVTTLGVLYVLDTTGEVHSVGDLRGKTVYTTGEGSVPQFVLESVLNANNLKVGEDVTVEYLADATAVSSKVVKQEAQIVMLPEPYVSAATTQIAGLNVAIDMTEAYSAVGGEGELTQACLIVRNGYADEHPGLLDSFMSAFADSVAFVNENTEEASVMIESAGIVGKAAIAKKAIPGCNIVCMTGDEMAASLNLFFAKYSLFAGTPVPAEAELGEMYLIPDEK